ncbi:MAG: Panacea domain-containing protein [Gammaproteobacteria bacterium]
MPYNSIEIANFFIENEPGISHLKLQKLVYCAHGWWLAFAKEQQVKDISGVLVDGAIEAWKYGPVYPSLFNVLRMKRHHSEPVQLVPSLEKRPTFTEIETVFLDWVRKRYSGISGLGMSELTHREGTPWAQITAREGVQKQLIRNELVEAEFSELLQDLRKNA